MAQGRGTSGFGLGLVAAMVLLPAGGALPLNAAVEPDVTPMLEALAPTAEAGEISILDGQIALLSETVEVVAPSGHVTLRVPWRFEQETPLPYGYYRQSNAQVYAYEDGNYLGGDAVNLNHYTSTWSEDGVFTLQLELSGVELRHEVEVHLYANYYSSYPYRNEYQQGLSALVATGLPPLVTERITTAPVLRGPIASAVDERSPNWAPGLTMTLDDSTADTAVAVDRFAILRVPYSFQRDTPRTGWGYEYGAAYFNAYDQFGQHLGSASTNWYRDHPCCSDPLDLDLQGNLTGWLDLGGSSEVRREVYVDVYFYWYGYTCTPQHGCWWHGNGHGEYGFAGLVYTVPEQAPDLSPNALAQRVLDTL